MSHDSLTPASLSDVFVTPSPNLSFASVMPLSYLFLALINAFFTPSPGHAFTTTLKSLSHACHASLAPSRLRSTSITPLSRLVMPPSRINYSSVQLRHFSVMPVLRLLHFRHVVTPSSRFSHDIVTTHVCFSYASKSLSRLFHGCVTLPLCLLHVSVTSLTPLSSLASVSP